MTDLDIAGQFGSIFGNISRALTTERFVDVLFAILFALLGFLMARLASRTFVVTVGKRLNLHQQLIWRRGIFYFIFAFFLIASLREAGFKLSVFLGAAGILTVALGFASQTSASNLISGLFLIGEGAFEVGDLIQLTLIRGQTIEGTVMSIDLLSVKLVTLDNTLIRVPNEQLIRSPVYNLTRFPIRRIPITLAIDFNEDISKVRRVLIEAADRYALVLDEPRPQVTVMAFRDSSIELLFTVWTQQQHYLRALDEIHERILNHFIEHAIRIPLPSMRVMPAYAESSDESDGAAEDSRGSVMSGRAGGNGAK